MCLWTGFVKANDLGLAYKLCVVDIEAFEQRRQQISDGEQLSRTRPAVRDNSYFMSAITTSPERTCALVPAASIPAQWRRSRRLMGAIETGALI